MMKKTRLNRLIPALVLFTTFLTLSAHAHPTKNLEQTLLGFTQGLIPNLDDTSQRQAFEIYRCMKFGDPNIYFLDNTLKEVAEALNENPKLTKEPFRNYQISSKKLKPVTPELNSFSKTYLRRIMEVTQDLYQIDTHPKLWKKIFNYKEPAGISKTEKKINWEAFLEKKIPSELKTRWADPSLAVVTRSTELFHFLLKERDELKAAGAQSKELLAISRALVDIIHTTGYQIAEILHELRSEDGERIISGFRKALDYRELFAQELGFKPGFTSAVKTFDGQIPTGIASEANHRKTLDTLEQGVIQESLKPSSEASPINVRHLSLVESPLRSCLGNDCATRTYLLKALDPNFHYFTLTDETGYSSGHVTVVLGTASQAEVVTPVAFIDKIQNIHNSDVPAALEAIRRSVLEKGYLLSLPENLGDHNGLSNEDATTAFVKAQIHLENSENLRLTEFTPHSNKYRHIFPNEYSRAYQHLPCRPLKPLLHDDLEWIPGKLNEAWTTDKIETAQLIDDVFKLKNSKVLSEKMKYIPTFQAIQAAGVAKDPEFQNTLKNWIEDPKESLQIRKQVLIYRWKVEYKSLLKVLEPFTFNEQIQIVQNLLDTPRYASSLLDDRAQLFEFLIHFRKNLKLRKILITQKLKRDKMPWLFPIAETLAKAPEIPDQHLRALLVDLAESRFNGFNLEKIFKILAEIQGTGAEIAIQDAFVTVFLDRFNSEAQLGRALAQGLTSEKDFEFNWSKALLSHKDEPRVKNYPTWTAFQQVGNDKLLENSSLWISAAETWLKSSTPESQLKTSFLLAHLGIHKSPLNRFRNCLGPATTEIENQIQKFSFLQTVEKAIAKKTNRETSNPDAAAFFHIHSKMESFEFVPIQFPPEGKTFVMGISESEVGYHPSKPARTITLTRPFEIQKTPVTQLQWQAVFEMTTRSAKPPIRANDLNKPQVSINYSEIHTFLENLNQLGDGYFYRLPTEAEWEYSARSDTQTSYFFGNDPQDLLQYGWYERNSHYSIHPVAELKPNPFGIYDMQGNVAELTSTEWSESYLPEEEFDPPAEKNGSAYVVKSGSFRSYANQCRPGFADRHAHSMKDGTAGFRLVRIPQALLDRSQIGN